MSIYNHDTLAAVREPLLSLDGWHEHGNTAIRHDSGRIVTFQGPNFQAARDRCLVELRAKARRRNRA